MHAISRVSSGTFSFIETETVIRDAFAQCIGGLLSVVVLEQVVEIECVHEEGLKITSVKSGSYRNSVSSDGRSATISVGDMYAEEERDFLVVLEIPRCDESESSCRCSRCDASTRIPLRERRPNELTGEEVVSIEVDRQRNRFLVSQAISEAKVLADGGDLRAALELLRKSERDLAETLSARLCESLTLELRALQEKMTSERMYETSGRAYALSTMSSHSAQRATARYSTTVSGYSPGPAGYSMPLPQAYQTSAMARMVSRSQQLNPNFVKKLLRFGDFAFRWGRFTGAVLREEVMKNAKLIITTIVAMVFGFFIGITLPSVSFTKINLPSGLISSFDLSLSGGGRSPEDFGSRQFPKIFVPTNPHGAELLPPGIIVAESDFYLRRLWGEPSEDLKKKPKYLVTFTVGFEQRNNINAAVKKFSEDFQILLFHYDGRTTEWDQFEWSKKAIHISAKKQTKWWYAKRFLHPDVVSAYEYIFIWDEDLGVEHFNAERYIELVKKHGLEISQPGLEPNNGLTWEMTKRRGDRDVHKETQEKPGWCSDPHLPPCAAFVEIMAPVFSREAWRCVWHMIQNDLVHGWGLDFALRRCVEPAHEKIGVVDSQWIIHQVIPSLGSQGESEKGKTPWQGVRERCRNEWTMFQNRVAEADKEYMEQQKVKE
ncbi:hypothetical protein Rs2_00703 [Raphanus sativus]|nr:hypothetical protein Rs2_00703 [Raphanus sativus]